MIKYIYKIIVGFLDKMKAHNIGAFATQAAFFTILSLFPFISVMLSLVKFTPITQQFLMSTVTSVSPDLIKPFMKTIINELYTNTSGTAFSITIVFAIWSAARSVLAIIYGLDSVYEYNDTRNYFLIRTISALYTILFMIAIIVSLGLIGFGNSIYRMIEKPFPLIYEFLGIFISHKEIFSFFILVLFFLLVYKLIPLRKYTLINLLPGAFLASGGWIGFSYGFSLYLKFSNNFTYTYGSLTMIIISMLWIYICMYILFIGAEINIYFNNYFNRLRRILRRRYRHRKAQ